jgi:cysteinyl-tRNA synthetase
MAKSEGNFLTLENAFIKPGLNPLVYRFAAFQTHYRKPMEYSDDSVEAARNGLLHLQNQVRQVAEASNESHSTPNSEFKAKFLEAINADLNMPRAMAVVQEMLKSSLSDAEKYMAILDFDCVLGLDMDQVSQTAVLPEEVQKLVDARIKAREAGDFVASDRLRDELQALGYMVQDTKEGMKVIKI